MSIVGRLIGLTTTVLLGVGVVWLPPAAVLQARPERPPRVGAVPTTRLWPAPEIRLNGEVDSNSPAIWDVVDGEARMHVFMSFAGTTRRSEGLGLDNLTPALDVTWTTRPEQGVWMEAVVADDAGTWYGYYHNERAGVECGDTGKVMPRIGAARSFDRGLTWEDLGPVLEAPPGTSVCETTNYYFHGGVGDLSVMLDPDKQFLYMFYSEYLAELSGQGVAMARMAWANRDAPGGRFDVWSQDAWIPPTDGLTSWVYPAGSPLFRTTRSWHDPDSVTNAFWGPAVHWNTYLNRYVMLLNRSRDVNFTPEGVYVSFSATLDQPGQWSMPRRILEGGSWYPQVIGLGPGDTDKSSGQVARLFLSGASSYFIEFQR